MRAISHLTICWTKTQSRVLDISMTSIESLVINRPLGKPFHCVCVKGNSSTGTILAYIEFYSLYRVVLCLTESYLGRAFTSVYAIDPVNGEGLDLEIDLDLSIPEIRSAYNYERYDEGVRMAAANSLLEHIATLDFDRALDQKY